MFKQDILNQLLNDNRETIVLDILPHAIALPDDPYSAALESPAAGIYLPGTIDPIIRKDRQYFKKSQHLQPDVKALTLQQILNSNEDVVDIQGKVIISIRNLITMKKYFTLEPGIPITAIKCGISVILGFLDNLCPYTHVNRTNYRLEHFIKNEYRELIYGEKVQEQFQRLLDEVMVFVGNDDWYIYFYKIQGTSLIIEKTCDYRVYDWHRQRLDKENEDEGD